MLVYQRVVVSYYIETYWKKNYVHSNKTIPNTPYITIMVVVFKPQRYQLWRVVFVTSKLGVETSWQNVGISLHVDLFTRWNYKCSNQKSSSLTNLGSSDTIHLWYIYLHLVGKLVGKYWVVPPPRQMKV